MNTAPQNLAVFCLAAIMLGTAGDGVAADGDNVWMDGVGSGYKQGARMLEFDVTRGFGELDFGNWEDHDLFLTRIGYSLSLNEVWAVEHWYGGNLFFTVDITGGIQDSPTTEYLVFGNLGLRYEFSTLGRFVPFVQGTVGAGATGIREPDLADSIQFMERVDVGVRYYLNESWSIIASGGYLHISNAHIREPNGGVNDLLISLGSSWSF